MNGFYPVLNDVHDKAVQDLPLAECALFEHIWRKLIGWKQWSDDIAISQLDEEIGSSRATILRLLKKLEEKRWIVVSRADGITNNIGIPKCPGIKMRLGVDPYHFDTATSIISTLAPVSEEDGNQCQNDTHNRQLLQTSPKDTFTENPPNPPNEVTTPEGQENEEGGVTPLDEDEDLERNIQKVRHIQNLIKQKWSKQIKTAPEIGKVKDALREFGGDHRPLVMAITKAADTLNTPTPASAMNLVITIARNYEGNAGATDGQLAEREQDIKTMEARLRRATEAQDEDAISQLGYLIEQKKESLARLRG